MASTAAATFCATLVDEWIRAGVRAAFVAPGSRSSPLALALAHRPELSIEVFHDERSTAFAALGHGLASGSPAVAVCTSGTAATHFHAAVVEADLSGVPLLVCTADRPPELQGVGAPQTILQTHLFGGAVRWFAEPGVPDAAATSSWRSLAARAAAHARGWAGAPGPVHLNLAFREPLVGDPGPLPPGRADGGTWNPVPAVDAAAAVAEAIAPRLRGRQGVIIAGGRTEDPAAVRALAAHLGWPLLADHRSGCRAPGHAVGHFDGLLRTATFAATRPDVVLRFGEPPASKVLSQWLTECGADVIAAPPPGRWIDPERIAATVVPQRGLAAALAELAPDVTPAGGQEALWLRADGAAAAAIDTVLEEATDVTEPGVARAALAAVPPNGALVVASSMPVRDLEWFGPPRDDVAVFANRGANGIDGVLSTAVGVALSGRPTVGLLGDIAFLHDTSALVGLGRRDLDLTIVVVDNDGGGIFSFLPQADVLPTVEFELLFGTPHGADLIAIAAAHGLRAEPWSAGDLAPKGVRVVVARTERAANVELHARLNDAIARAVERLGDSS